KQVVPGNASESIWDIMARAALSEAEERALKDYAEDKGLAYLSTPFSRMAADRLESMGVQAYKIGSGECNNYPLVDHVAAFGKPMIVSTGMNDLSSIGATVEILDKRRVPYALLQCTSMYPTPYDRVQLGALADLAAAFPRALLGLSCHSIGVYTGLGAIPLGARIVEKHFTSDPTWPGPDIPISITPAELGTLVAGSRAIFAALGGHKRYLREEKVTADFAYACVVTTQSIRAGERLTVHNCWVKRPGTGEILAVHYPKLLGRRVTEALCAGQQLEWTHLSPESP
ncbi:MAG: N-acetylneuraminate synthase family protein, partial [Polyangiales bacterium]